MFITRFNRFFDRHSRVIYIVLGVVISLSFVVFVTPGSMSGGASATGRGGSVGRMYGRDISHDEFMHQIRLADLANFLRTGQFMSRDSAQLPALVQETLRRMRMMHEARQRGLDAVARSEMEDLLRRVFARDGAFDRDLFDGFLENVLYRNGMDGADLDEALRQNIVMARLETDIYGTIHVSPAEARDLFDQFNEEFVVRYAAFNADMGKDGAPTEAEITAHFEAHRDEMRTADKRRVRVVQFAAADHREQAAVEEAEIVDYYNRLKDSTYKDKPLEEVRAQIAGALTNQKSLALAGAAASAMQDALRRDAPAGEAPSALAERLSSAAAAAGLSVIDTGAFGEDGGVPELGTFPSFQRAAYRVTEASPLSEVIYDAGRYFLACWLETVPGEAPTELDEAMRRQVGERVLEAEARAVYASKVEPYRQPLESSETAWDLTGWYEQQLSREAGLDPDEKQRRTEAFRDTIRDYIAPYFVRRQKRVRVAVFRPETNREGVTIDDAAVAAHFEANRATYGREEVRARQITVSVPAAATEAQKTEKRAVLEGVLAALRDGAAFEHLAETFSEDAATKSAGGDMGSFARGDKPAALETAAFAMEPGEISGIIEIPGGLAVLKLEERRAGRTLADVSEEIRTKLVAEAMEQRAGDAAAAFAEALANEWEKAQGSGATPADIMAAVAAKSGIATEDSAFFSEGGFLPPFGNEPDLARAAFALVPDAPMGEAVKGKEAFFVACWLETKAPELPRIDSDPMLVRRVVARVRRDRAVAAARARAGEAHALVQAALQEGKSVDDAIATVAGVTFATTEPFTRNRPASALTQAQTLMKTLEGAAPGSLLAPLEHSNGAIVAYLVSRTLPAEDRFAAERERFENQAMWTKRYAIVQDFYDRLEKASQTVLNEPWRTHAAGRQQGG